MFSQHRVVDGCQSGPFLTRHGGCRRIARIEGILRVIGADAAEPERVRRAEASVTRLREQLAELQASEALLAEQARSELLPTHDSRTFLLFRVCFAADGSGGCRQHTSGSSDEASGRLPLGLGSLES